MTSNHGNLSFFSDSCDAIIDVDFLWVSMRYFRKKGVRCDCHPWFLYFVMVGDDIPRPLLLGLKRSETEPPVHSSFKKKTFILIVIVKQFTSYGWRHSVANNMPKEQEH